MTDTVTTLQKIKELAAKQFGSKVDAIDENAEVSTLGIDSLGFLEFLFTLEDEFGISIPQDSVRSVRTLSGLAEVIDGLLASEAAKPARA